MSSSLNITQNDCCKAKVTDRFDLSGKNFLITGGARGIGLACAEAIAQLGAGIAVIDTLPEPSEELSKIQHNYDVTTSYAQGDVTCQASLEAAFTKIVKAHGQLHGGLIAAGICIDQPLLSSEWDICQKTLNVNVMGLLWTIKLLAQHMVDSQIAGSIVAISSMNGQGIYVPAQPCFAYNASKAAVKGVVGPLAGELGEHGIRVNSISPGAIQTPLLKRLEARPDTRAILDFYRKGAPLRRLGVPQDLTPIVCYLLSDAASFTTGADFLVTGGFHVGASHKPVPSE